MVNIAMYGIIGDDKMCLDVVIRLVFTYVESQFLRIKKTVFTMAPCLWNLNCMTFCQDTKISSLPSLHKVHTLCAQRHIEF